MLNKSLKLKKVHDQGSFFSDTGFKSGKISTEEGKYYTAIVSSRYNPHLLGSTHV